jgi:multisubunit Na+/H+ antiporter MnhF subunit
MADSLNEADGPVSSGGAGSLRDGGQARHPRWRGIAGWVLVVLACILSVLSVVTVFARNQLLNTDAYVKTVAPLASNPAIQTQVAKKVSENLISRANIETRVKDALPPKAAFLAVPITSGLETVTNELALKAVQSKQFYELWVAVNRASHKQLVAVLTGSSVGSVSTKNGKVTINLAPVEVNIKKKLDAKGITVFDKVPAVKGLNFVLFQSKDLVTVQKLTKVLNDLAIVLPIIALLGLAASVVLARNRRRGLVRAAGGLALSMAAILVVIGVARNQYLSGLSPNQSVPANQAVIDTVTANLRLGVRIILIVAIVVSIVALIAGNRRLRAWMAGGPRPQWMTDGPVHAFVVKHRKGLQWGILGLGLLLLVVWTNPTTLVAVIVVAVALVLVGLVGVYGSDRPRLSPPGVSAEGPLVTK